MADLTSQFHKAVRTEDKKAAKDSKFAEVLRTIDSLKQRGVLEKTSYRFPQPDTIGRYLNLNAATRSESHPAQRRNRT
jgi:hypothetical protein